jgi:pimeloyl-ACP methyl ester carboxylesterase
MRLKHFSTKSKYGRLRGMIHEVSGDVNPVVLIVHGYFSSDRVGYNRFYFDMANILASNGYTTIRCDLSGKGESDGDGNIERITFEDHVNDLRDITKYIYNRYQRKIILIGHCIGCLVSLETCCRIPIFFDKMIFISLVYFNNTILSRLFDKNMIKELKDKGQTYRKEIVTDNSFFNKQMSLSNIANKVKNCKIPISLLFGESDQFFEDREIEMLCKKSNLKPIIIPKGGHNFEKKLSREILIEKILFFINR